MANFVLVYKGGGGMAATEAERQAVMAEWGQWFGALGQAIVDGGNPFGNSSSVAADGTVKDGASSSLTVTVKVQPPLLPELSVDSQVTVVVPLPKSVPEAGVQVTAVAPSQLSVAVGA